MANTEQLKLTNDDLYIRQIELLKNFLERNAISLAQYEKSYHDLTVKMYPDGINISEEKYHVNE